MSVFQPVEGTSLASASRTTTQTISDIDTNGCKYLNVVLDMTTVGSGSVTLTINGKDPASGKYYLILSGAAVTTNSTNRCKVGPNITASANAKVNPPTDPVSEHTFDAAMTPCRTISASSSPPRPNSSAFIFLTSSSLCGSTTMRANCSNTRRAFGPKRRVGGMSCSALPSRSATACHPNTRDIFARVSLQPNAVNFAATVSCA